MSAVTVVIAARDAETTLAFTLDSLLAQHMQDWHAVIVDDGSTDGTPTVASDYCDRDRRFRMIGANGLGAAAARNEGLRLARGSAVLFLDADDWMAPDHLARLSAALTADTDAGASYCGYVRVTPKGQAFMPRFERGIAADARRVFRRSNPLAPHSVLLARDRIESLGGFDTRFRTCEDWDLWQRLALADARFVPVEGLHARYRLRQGSVSADVEQLFRDAVVVIANGFAGKPDFASGKALSVAWFALWCRAVAAGQHRRSVEDLPVMSSVPLRPDEVGTAVSVLMEALCTGGCCNPGRLARDWTDTEGKLREVLASAVDPAVHRSVLDGFASVLGVDPAAPRELVSVVIPAYRAVQTIGETLQSVQTQTHSPLDIVVVDDGSTDDTAATALSYAANDPRISVMQQANAGVAAARNLGWRAAASDLIAFVDADDLWAPTKIERQLAALRAEGPQAGLAYTWYARIDGDSLITSRSHRPDARGDVLKAIFLGNFIGNGSAALITRAALEHAGGFDSSLRTRGAQGCEDFSIYFRIAEKFRFALVPEQLTGYRVLPGNMSSDMLRMLRSFDLVVADMLERHPEHRGEAMEGRAWFLEWSLLTAAERGALRTWFKLFLIRLRQSPSGALRLLLRKSPRAVLRGLRLRIVGTPRRRRDYAPVRFPIGGYKPGHG